MHKHSKNVLNLNISELLLIIVKRSRPLSLTVHCRPYLILLLNTDGYSCRATDLRLTQMHFITISDHPVLSLTPHSITWSQSAMFDPGAHTHRPEALTPANTLSPEGPGERSLDILLRGSGWVVESVTCLCKKKTTRHIQAWGKWHRCPFIVVPRWRLNYGNINRLRRH